MLNLIVAAVIRNSFGRAALSADLARPSLPLVNDDWRAQMHDLPVYVSNIDWGDVPTWITAVAAVFALIAAAIAVSHSLRLLKLEQQREDRAETMERARQDREARAEQADQIAVWISSPDTALVFNGSAQPVYAAHVEIIERDTGNLIFRSTRTSSFPARTSSGSRMTSRW
jgi:hypothetical protein